MIKLILNLKTGSYRLVDRDVTDRKITGDFSNGCDAARAVKLLLAVVEDMMSRDYLHRNAALRIREAPDKLSFLVGRPCLHGMLRQNEAAELELGIELLEFKLTHESRREAEHSAATNGWDDRVVSLPRVATK